jgi:hypothetical protein
VSITTGGSGEDITLVANSPLTINSLVSNAGGGDITLTATNDGGGDDDLTISADVMATGGNGAVDLNSGTDLIIDNDAEVSTEGSGQITGDADRAIDISSGSTLVQTESGSISLTANAGSHAGNFVGISVNAATISTTSGAITLTGTGGDTGDNNHGVSLTNMATISSTGTEAANPGAFTITGTAGVGAPSGGVTMTNASITTADAGVSITGNSATDDGVSLSSSPITTTDTGGSITIMGTTTGTGGVADGVDASSSALSTMGDTATISVTGNSAGGDGVRLYNDSDVTVAGASTATITISGTTTGANGGDGVRIDNAGDDVTITSAAGAISVTGSASGMSGDGVEIEAGIGNGTTVFAIDANNGATITITGTGDESASGVKIDSPISSENGTVTIRSEDGGSDNDDIRFGAGGDITSTSGTITIDAENADNTADVFMADGAVINAGSGLIDVDADVDVTLGRLQTTGNVTINAGGNVIDGGSTGGEDVSANTLTATIGGTFGTSDADAGDIDTAVASLNVTSGGNQWINETDTLTQINLNANNGAADIDLEAGGSVTDADGATDIRGNLLTADITGSLGVTGPAIDTRLVTADITVTGSIDIDEYDGIDLLDVDTANGFIRVDAAVSAAGDLTATDVDSSATDDDSNDIILTTTNTGNVVVADVNAGVLNDVVIIAASSILESAADDVVKIVADGLRLQANSGSVGAEAASVIATGADNDDNLLNVTAAFLEGSTSGGGFFVHDSRSVSIEDTDLTGTLNGTDNDNDGNDGMSGGFAINSPNGTVRINAAGSIMLTEEITASGQLVSLDAIGGGIRSDMDAAMSGDRDILAAQVALRSDNGIGTMADHLEIDATDVLAFRNDTAGSVYIDDVSGGLVIDDADAMTESLNNVSGATRVVARSPLTVSHDVTTVGMLTLIAVDSAGPGDHLTVDADVTVESTSSSIVLSGGDNVTLSDGSAIVATASDQRIRIYGDYDDGSDTDGVATDAQIATADTSGTIITLLGAIASEDVTGFNGLPLPSRNTGDAASAYVFGGGQDDLFILRPSDDDAGVDADETTTLLLDGVQGADTYRIHTGGLDGDNTALADVIIDDTGTDAASDRATVWGSSASDEIDVFNLDGAADNPDRASEEDVAEGGEINFIGGPSAGQRIIYTDTAGADTDPTLEFLTVNGGRDNTASGNLDPTPDTADLFHVNPSQTTQILIHGNNPQFGTGPNDVPNVDGDVLDFQPFGHRFALIGKSIQTNQTSSDGLSMADDDYERVLFRNIERLPIGESDGTKGTEYLRFDFNTLDETNTSSPTQDHPDGLADVDPNDPGQVTPPGAPGVSRPELEVENDYLGVTPRDFYGRDLDGAGPETDTATYGWVVTDPDDETQGVGVVQSNLGAGSFGGGAYEDLQRDRVILGDNEGRTFRTDLANGWYLVTVQTGETINMQVRDAVTDDVISEQVNFEDAGVFSFVVLVENGSGLQLTFEAPGNTGLWSVAGLDIRPADILTFGSPEPGTLTADGATIDVSTDTFNTAMTSDPEMDFFGIFNASPDAIITIFAKLDIDGDEIPDIDLNVLGEDGSSIDLDPNTDGVQVQADTIVNIMGEDRGIARFGLQRPTVPGSAFISFQEFDGAQTGCLQIDYVGPNVRRFDFDSDSNGADSPTQAPINQDSDVSGDPLVGTAGGYISVNVNDRFSDPELGYGWNNVGSRLPFDSGASGGGERENLLRDGHRAADSPFPFTFSTYVDPAGTYEVNLFAHLPPNVGNGIQIEGVAQSFTPREEVQQLTFRNISVSADGVFDLTFNGDGAFQIYGLEIVDQSLLNTVSITSVTPDGGAATMAFPVALDADRTSVDTIIGNSGVNNSYVTVATTLGTITTADALTSVPGLQIATNGSGDFTFDIRRPGGAGTPTISVQTIDGTGSLPPGTGSGIINYVTQTLGATGLLFDFDDNSNIQTQTGYTSVEPRQLYDVSTGFGWTGTNASRDLPSITSLSTGAHAQLLRDAQGYVAPRTFRADVTNGAYEVTATLVAGNNIQITDALGGATNPSPLVSGLNANSGVITTTFTYNATANNGVQLTFENPGTRGSLWKVSALTIRPQAAVTPITVTPPAGPLASDGASVSTWTVSGLTAGEVYTITPTAGTIQDVTVPVGGATMADFHSAYSGIQIVADAMGTATFDLIAPAAPGDVTVTVNDVTGAATGTSAALDYDTPSPWLFDFDSVTNSTITTATAMGMPAVTSVGDHDTFAAHGGYGWSRSNGRGDFDIGAGAPTALRQDGVYTSNSTFQVAVEDGDYDVRIYTSNQNNGRPLDVTIEGVTTTINPTAGTYENFLFDNGGGGFTVNDGVLDIQMNSTFTTFFINGLDVGTNGALDGTNQQTLNTVAVGSGADALTQSQLDNAVAGALDRIAAGGASQATLDTLAAVTVSIADLSGTHLGVTNEAANTIQIDLDAAGHGWFIDDTPLDDTEFSLAISETELNATASSPASGSIDLLTTLLHEFAHILGYGHEGTGLLDNTLETGTRHVDDVFSDEALFNNLD